MDGQLEERECGMVESMEPAQAVRHKQCETLGAAQEPGGFESIEPTGVERDRWASREAEVSESERVNHFAPADLMLYVIHV